MIYLDHAATTPVLPQAADAAMRAMTAAYGNPSSLHALGRDAMRILNDTRAALAAILGCADNAVVFTSGGTEANHMAIASALAGKSRGRIVTTAWEHPSVSNAVAAYKQKGFEVVTVLPERDGRAKSDSFAAALSADTVLVCCCAVCGEIGTVLPVDEVAALMKSICPDAWLHCDAVQALGRMALPKLPHSLSLSGHKIGAPKGVGAVVTRHGARLRAVWQGGGQEFGLRSGTENVPAIAGLGVALSQLPDSVQLDALKQYALTKLSCIQQIVIIPPHDAPHIVAFALPPLPGEVLVRKLSDAGFCLSSGTACHKGKKSQLLVDMKTQPTVAGSALRLSLGHGNTEADIDALVEALRAI